MVIRRARFVALAMAVGACRPGGLAVARTGAATDACLVAAGPAAADTVVVGVAGSVNASTLALRPRTSADSFAFAQVYETLVRVACDGTLVPALAERWRGDGAGRTWTMFIRPDAVFHDGTPVTARHVADAWKARRHGTDAAADPRVLAVEGVTLEGERTLTVHLRDAHRRGPRLLADPYFAVHHPAPDSTRMLGTGRYALAPPDAAGLSVVSATLVPSADPLAAPVVSLRRSPAGNALDLIDQGVDAMVATDRRVIEYAATRSELRARPLPPDRAYVLLSTARYPDDGVPSTAPVLAREPLPFAQPADPRWHMLRSALARDVLRRTGEQHSENWWISEALAAGCAMAGPTPSAGQPPRQAVGYPRTQPRIVYLAGDTVAAAIAARLVALATENSPGSPESGTVRELLPELVTPAGGPIIATSLLGPALAAGLLRGAELAYLIAMPRQALDPCATWTAFAARVPWIDPSGIAFLVESGPTLITSPRAPALVLDWNNVLRVLERPDSGGRPR